MIKRLREGNDVSGPLEAELVVVIAEIFQLNARGQVALCGRAQRLRELTDLVDQLSLVPSGSFCCVVERTADTPDDQVGGWNAHAKGR